MPSSKRPWRRAARDPEPKGAVDRGESGNRRRPSRLEITANRVAAGIIDLESTVALPLEEVTRMIATRPIANPPMPRTEIAEGSVAAARFPASAEASRSPERGAQAGGRAA